MFRPTEDTITELLLARLKAEGISALAQTQFATPTGLIKPDVFLEHEKLAIQAKLGDRGKLVVALGQLWDGFEAGLDGGFVVIYNEQLRNIMSVQELERKVEILESEAYAFIRGGATSVGKKGGFTTLAKWITQQAKVRVKVEIEPATVISLLRRATEYLASQLASISGLAFADVFGGKSVFENILQYEEREYPEVAMRTATAHLLVNQILFYLVLAKADPRAFDDIDPKKLKKPGDLLEYFRRARARDYAAVYSFDLASRLPPAAQDAVLNIVKALKMMEVEKVSHDVLGTIFHDLIPLEVRKPVAAYYTNVTAAEMLAELAIEDPHDKVADLAVGSGGLLVGAYRAKKRKATSFDETIHKAFVENDLTGIDVMPFAAHLATVNLALQAPLYQTNKVRIAVHDSTTLAPGTKIPPIMRILRKAFRHGRGLTQWFEEGSGGYEVGEEAYMEGGVVVLEGPKEEFAVERVDVVIMNPPFTRQERIPSDYKARLDERLTSYAPYLHGQLGYYGYFIPLADSFLKEGGRMALVLPATVLRIQSCEGVRRLLTASYDLEAIITTLQRAAFSEAVQFREILLLARKRNNGSSSTNSCLVATLKRIPPTLVDAQSLASKLRNAISVNITFEDSDASAFLVSQQELATRSSNLYHLIAFKNKWLADYWDYVMNTAKDRLIPLNRFVGPRSGEILRGIETARGGVVQALTILHNEARAIKKRDIWVRSAVAGKHLTARNRFTSQQLSVPLQNLLPALRRVATLERMDLKGESDYVLVDHFPNIRQFMAASDLKPPLVGFWARWRRYVQDRLTNLVLVRRGDVSASGTCHLAFYSETPIAPPGVSWSVRLRSPEESKLLCLWFNSTFNLLQLLYNRKETRGAFIQLDEYVLEETLVPAFEETASRTELLELFDSIKLEKFPSLLEQLTVDFEPRTKVDRALLQNLGAKEPPGGLSKLYKAMAEEINLLKQLMAGIGGEEEE